MEQEYYSSKHFTAEQIDQRLLKGTYDDAVAAGYQGTKEEFDHRVATMVSSSGDSTGNQEVDDAYTKVISEAIRKVPQILTETEKVQARTNIGAISRDDINDGNFLNAGSITSSKIAVAAIGKSHIADEAVTNSKIKDGTISHDKIDPSFKMNLSTGAYLGDGTLTPAQMSQLVVNDLTTGGADKALSAEMGKELLKKYDIDINGYYIERGTLNTETGEEGNDRFRLRTNFVRSPFNVNMADGYRIAAVLEYSENREFIRRHTITDFTSFRINEETPYLYRITFRQDDGGEIFEEENIFADNTEFNGVLTGIERLHDDVLKNKEELARYSSIERVIEDNFNVEKVVGDSPSIASLSVLNYLSDGEIGFPMQDVTYESNTFLTVRLNERTSKQYSICAVVLKGSSMPAGFSPSTSNSMQISLEYNFNPNGSYANTIARGLIYLDGSRYIAYNVSGIIDSRSSLPTTAYIRIPKSYTYNIAVDKVLLLDMDYWDESFLDIIASNVDSAWAGTTAFTKSELSAPATSLDRRLFEGIVFWGSSTTEGRWVQQVAANLKMPYYWGGVGSEKIWGIMGRMGVLPLRIKTPFTIPASSQVPVNLPDNYTFYVKWKGTYKGAYIWGSKTVQSYKLLVNPCYIAGVKGNLIGGGANSDIPLQFQRLEDGNAVTTKAYEPVFTYGFRETRDCVQFLACHFNGGESSTEELVELYKKMYEVSCNKKVLIFGRHKSANGVVTSPTLETLQEQEIALEDEFGLMFFNTREYMCGRGFERFKELYPTYYTDADIEQASQGITPDCLYVNASNVHFNDMAYTVLTEAVTDRLVSLGYDKFRYGGDSPHLSYN